MLKLITAVNIFYIVNIYYYVLFSEFSFKMEENLESLRQAATCAICTDFYTRPKKLPNCPHVFCLHCIQRHLQVNCDRNFPPCPMCRKPITSSRFKVVNLDPGIAEQTIVDFVKQYETCDICASKSNPNFSCEKCSAYICDSCLPCHKTLKPSHNVVSIIPRRDSNKVPIKMTRTCMVHEDQPLDLFCIICRRILCIHCKEYTHAHCKHPRLEYERYKRGFLKFFVESSEDLQTKLEFRTLGRIVYIGDIANAARLWLKELQIELKSCLTFFQECKTKLEKAVQNENECRLLYQRLQHIVGEIGTIIQLGEISISRTEAILKKDTKDAEVASSILTTEQYCWAFLHYRQKYAGHTLFVHNKRSKAISMESSAVLNIQQLCKCNLTAFSARYSYIRKFRHCTTLSDKMQTTEIDKNRIELGDIKDAKMSDQVLYYQLRCTFTGKPIDSSTSTQTFNTQTIEICTYAANSITDCLYSNIVLDRYEKPEYYYSKKRNHIRTKEIRTGDTCNAAIHDSETDHRYTVLMKKYNIFVQFKVPGAWSFSTHSLKGDSLCTTTVSSNIVICITGKREYGAGLESVFLYTDNTHSASNAIANMCGISVSAKVAKFYEPGRETILDEEYEVITDNKAYTVFIQNNYMEGSTLKPNTYLLSYRTIPAVNYISDKLVVAREENDVVETAIPVTIFFTDLLCHLESGLYFARKEDNGDMTVGNITFCLQEIKPNTVQTVRQSDTDIPLWKLQPLTMVERTNKGIIVVCSVEDHNSKFVMIRTDKVGPEAIEILDVDYTLSDLRVYKESHENVDNEALDTDISDSSVTASTQTEAGTTENDDKCQLSTDTESNFVTTVVGETKAKISESTLGNIADATLVDLEMDIDGKIMFLLERKEGNSYCVCTKYTMP